MGHRAPRRGHAHELRAVNLLVRFLLELGALAALSVWSWLASESTVIRLLLTFATPLVAALVWGTFVAPNATRRVPDPWRVLVELTVFAPAVAALLALGWTAWALALAGAYAVNLALMFRWHQRER